MCPAMVWCMTRHASHLDRSFGRPVSKPRRPRLLSGGDDAKSSNTRPMRRKTPCHSSQEGQEPESSTGALEAAQPSSVFSADTAPAAAPWAANQSADLQWSDKLPAHLVHSLVAEQLQVSEEEAGARLQQLLLLLPGLREGLPGSRRLQLLARLAADVSAVAAALLQLRAVFPESDVSQLAVRVPSLVLDADMVSLRQQAEELRELLPGVSLDRLVETNPVTLLDLEGFKETVVCLKTRMPYPQLQKALQVASDPRFPARGGAPQQRGTAPKLAGPAGLPPAVPHQSGT